MSRSYGIDAEMNARAVAIEFAVLLLDRAKEQGSSNFGSNVSHHIQVAVEEALEDDPVFHKLVCSMAVWCLNRCPDAKRIYRIDTEGRIDYHDERIQDPAEAILAEQDSIMADMDRLKSMVDDFKANVISNSNDEGSK